MRAQTETEVVVKDPPGLDERMAPRCSRQDSQRQFLEQSFEVYGKSHGYQPAIIARTTFDLGELGSHIGRLLTT